MKSKLLGTAPSLTEAVYLQLRKDLLTCQIRPGEKLNIGSLAERMDVNLGPVREALSRLTAEGLVTAESQRGFRAAPVSLQDLLDLTNARIQIETWCLQAAIAKGDLEWEAAIVAAFHRLIHTPELEKEGEAVVVSETWATAHANFHAVLVSACDSAWMLRLRDILYSQSERYRRLSVPLRAGDSGDGRSSRQERDHRKLMEAALARDAELAAQVIAEHFNQTAGFVRIFAEDGETLRAGGEPTPAPRRRSRAAR